MQRAQTSKQQSQVDDKVLDILNQFPFLFISDKHGAETAPPSFRQGTVASKWLYAAKSMISSFHTEKYAQLITSYCGSLPEKDLQRVQCNFAFDKP